MIPKVELHVHLDGAVRFETLAELAKKKSIPLPSYDAEILKERLITKDPANLQHVLDCFNAILPAISGDADAIERAAYELCKIQADQGVIYFEVRFSPHLFSNTSPNISWQSHSPYKANGDLEPDQVVQCVLRGLQHGERDFGIKARAILCCICGYPNWSRDVLNLCVKYGHEGVVGIDLASSAAGNPEQFEMESWEAFQEAKRLGVHRTVHAGEAGSAESVQKAIQEMHAERIGHGYKIIDNEEIYQNVKNAGYHLEVCPLSSWVTGAVDEDWQKHPVKRFALDNVNFSINTDDPTCFGNSIDTELELCREKFDFTDDILFNCQLNAAKSAFLPDREKMHLIERLKTGATILKLLHLFP